MEFTLGEIYNFSDARLKRFNSKLYEDNKKYSTHEQLLYAFIKNASTNEDIQREDLKYTNYPGFGIFFNGSTLSDLKAGIDRALQRELVEEERKLNEEQRKLNEEQRKLNKINSCNLYLVKLDSEIPTVKDINTKFKKQIQKMKRGDLIENTSISGYRSEGRYIIDEIDSKLVAVNLDTVIDDYGAVPPDFLTITQFPIGYFDEENIITVSNKELKKQSEWHSEIQPRHIDCKKLGLSTLKLKNVFIDSENDTVYTIINFNYCIGQLFYHKEYTKKDFINLFKNQDIISLILENGNNVSFVEFIHKEHNIPYNNILMFDYKFE